MNEAEVQLALDTLSRRIDELQQGMGRSGLSSIGHRAEHGIDFHVPRNNWSATAAPGVTDDSADGYGIGSEWLDTTNDKAYVCTDATLGAAVWKGLSAAMAPTLLVAATDANSQTKLAADYICDGTADQVQINAAINALPAIGGTVVLSEGTFTLAASISLPTSAKVRLQGQGRQKTLIQCAAASAFDLIVAAGALGNCEFEHFLVDGTNQTSGSGINVRYMSSARFYNVDVRNCAADGFTKNAVANDADGIVFIACETALNGARGWTLANFYAGRLWGCAATQNTDDGIYISGNDNVIDSCVMDTNSGQGIELDTALRTRIIGCYIGDSGGYGVNEINAANFSVIVGNNFTGNVSGAVNRTGATTIIADNPGVTDYPHPLVTLGAGSDAALALVGQQLTLADVLTPTEHTAIGNGAPHHAAVTLGADVDAILSLSTQQIVLDTQTANLVLAGPATAPAADPTFRALVSADLPSTVVETGDAAWIDLTDGGASTAHTHAGGAGMSLIVKEVNEIVNNSNVLQNDDELLFAVAANEVWQFEGVLNIVTLAAADFRLTFTGPSGAVGSFSAIYGDDATGNIDAGGGILAATLSLLSASTGRIVRFWGGIHNGANAGNLTLQWAQDTANASNTQVYAGSYIKFQIET